MLSQLRCIILPLLGVIILSRSKSEDINCWTCIYGGRDICSECVPVCTSKLCTAPITHLPTICSICSGCGGCSDCYPCYLDNTSIPSLVRTVSAPAGNFLGIHRPTGVTLYLGIPYAENPTGKRRFRPAVPKAYLPRFDATQHGPACMQAAVPAGDTDDKLGGVSEDCLRLNVYVPDTKSTAALPVLFWIHGGGWVVGHGDAAESEPQDLASSRGVVVVSVNYRLGALGFLQLGDLEGSGHGAGGMNGVLDQQIALKWVKTNIMRFNGDPDKVMIFGESAGGLSVCSHLLSPSSAGLFHAAVVESGPCAYGPWEAYPYKIGLEVGRLYLAQLNASSLEDLQALPWAAFGKAAWPPTNWSDTAIAVPYFVDHGVLPDEPSRLIENYVNSVPTILVSNHYDAGGFFSWNMLGTAYATRGRSVSVYGPLPANETEFNTVWHEAIASHWGEATADEAIQRYSLDRFHGDATAAAAKMIADVAIQCPTWKMASALRAALGGSVWVMDFYAMHGPEQQYVFNVPHFLCTTCRQVNSKVSHVVSNKMQVWWTQLLTQHTPSTPSEWPIWSITHPQLMAVHPFAVRKPYGVEFVNMSDCTLWSGNGSGFVWKNAGHETFMYTTPDATREPVEIALVAFCLFCVCSGVLCAMRSLNVNTAVTEPHFRNIEDAVEL